MELVPSEHPETRMNILLIGPPGSGKGTQGARVALALGLEHIAAGDILRGEVAAGTPLGEKLKQHLDRGELAPRRSGHAAGRATRTGRIASRRVLA